MSEHVKGKNTLKTVALWELGTGAALLIFAAVFTIYGSISRSNKPVLHCVIQDIKIIKSNDLDNGDEIWLKVQDVNRMYAAFKFEDETQVGKPYSKISDEINVYYDKTNPENSEIKNWWTQYFIPLFVSVFGLISIGASLVMFRPWKKDTNQIISDKIFCQ